MEIKQKVTNIINKLSNCFVERDKIVRLVCLALLSNESVFLLGPPGVAKSLIARKLKDVIKNGTNFEYLMNQFSTPDELFGPISLKKLDEDIYERKYNGYLPSSNIVFLDEIWKASSSIQNTLLTIINEKIFKNGTTNVNVPLALLIAASNELPAQNEGLEALYDRFILRIYVDNIYNEDNFYKLLNNDIKDETFNDNEKLTIDEINKLIEDSLKIKIDKLILDFIHTLRKRLNIELKEQCPYISDRKWRKIANILRVSAYINNRTNISIPDLCLIKNMIWDNLEQIPLVNNVFTNTLIDHLFKFSVGVDLNDLIIKKEQCELEIKNATKDEFIKYKVDICQGDYYWGKKIEQEFLRFKEITNTNYGYDWLINENDIDTSSHKFKCLLINPNDKLTDVQLYQGNFNHDSFISYDDKNKIITFQNGNNIIKMQAEFKKTVDNEKIYAYKPEIEDEIICYIHQFNIDYDSTIKKLISSSNIFDSEYQNYIEEIKIEIDAKLAKFDYEK